MMTVPAILIGAIGASTGNKCPPSDFLKRRLLLEVAHVFIVNIIIKSDFNFTQ